MISQPTSFVPELPAPENRKHWFTNWRILVPVVLSALFLCLALVVFGFVWFVHSLFADSYPYKAAIRSASESPAVAEQIGVPFRVGWREGGRLHYHNYDAEAHFVIPISGPKGRGRIVVTGKAHDGRWSFQTLEVDVEGQSAPIELSNPDAAPAAPPAPTTTPAPAPGSV
ncbi:MAG: cytochrome c oxidase assembly factor Coa1 family protein [Candidatus Acidiferrales bacterium]